ncbi:hypothetical protein HDV00_004589 [Rhizophlyctis rosea]|nr:hypothetical protein HDV00_004589 [Rhizophlyctis rosea]
MAAVLAPPMAPMTLAGLNPIFNQVPVHIQATTFNTLPEEHDALTHLSSDDETVRRTNVEKIASILAKYGMEKDLAIVALHRHEDMAADMCFVYEDRGDHAVRRHQRVNPVNDPTLQASAWARFSTPLSE